MRKSVLKCKGGFSITQVPTLAITLGIIAIVLGLMATVLVQVQSTQTSGSVTYNITQEGIDAQEDFSAWQGTWVVIIAAAVVIGIVSAYLFFKGK